MQSVQSDKRGAYRALTIDGGDEEGDAADARLGRPGLPSAGASQGRVLQDVSILTPANWLGALAGGEAVGRGDEPGIAKEDSHRRSGAVEAPGGITVPHYAWHCLLVGEGAYFLCILGGYLTLVVGQRVGLYDALLEPTPEFFWHGRLNLMVGAAFISAVGWVFGLLTRPTASK
jgi:hypothetical protein